MRLSPIDDLTKQQNDNITIRESRQKNLFWVHSIHKIEENQTLLESSGQMPKLELNEMSDLDYNITDSNKRQENIVLKQQLIWNQYLLSLLLMFYNNTFRVR